MKVRLDVLEERLRAAAGKFVPEDEAAYFAALMLEAHLNKAPRMNPLEEAADDLGVWAARDEHEFRVEVDNESVLLLDLDGLAPSLKLKYVHDELERRARKNGIAAVGFRNSSGVITLGPRSEGLARRDLIGVAMFDGGTGCTVPFGGTKGVFGTLPLAYAIPTADRPITLDMAMTEIPCFQIKDAKARGEALPASVAVDQDGLPTTDAAAALDDDGAANLLPIGGGFKGYAGVPQLFPHLVHP
ncbi:MAG: Ldh family oxidoreductase [Thermoleophilia bacterium]